MLALAVRAGKLTSAPRLTRLKVENTRTESFTDAELETVPVLGDGAPATAKDPEVQAQPDLVPPIVFGGWTGWRMRSDVFTLQWSQVDFEAGTVTRWSRGTDESDLADGVRKLAAFSSATVTEPRRVVVLPGRNSG